MGRLTRDPEQYPSTTKFSLAVDRRGTSNGQQQADFINCVAFGKSAEFVGKYLHKGSKILLEGHILTGSFKKQDGTTVYTTDVAIDSVEFAESKNASQNTASDVPNAPTLADELPTMANPTAKPANAPVQPSSNPMEGFMNIPEGIDADLPFARPVR